MLGHITTSLSIEPLERHLGRSLIAVVGSLDTSRQYDVPLRDSRLAQKACEAIGYELATRSCDIVVYSSKPAFIESLIVRGYVSAKPGRSDSVQIRAPIGTAYAEFPEAGQHPDLFKARVDTSPDWEVSYFRSLVEVQGIVLIGGGRSTLVTGLMALALGTPIVAVATFGGSAEKVWSSLDRVRNEATQDDLDAMAAPWHDGSSARLVQSLLGQGARRAERTRQHHQEVRRRRRRASVSLVIAGMFILLGIGSVPLMYGWKPGTAGSLTLLCGGPLLFAVAGAIIRNTFDQDSGWLRPAILGLAAGALSFLLFVAAQLATTPDALAGNGAHRLVFFVLPIGFIAGLTFDAVYARLRATDVADPSILGKP